MKISNKYGFSIVEVLVACMFVTIIALSGLTSFTYFRNLNNRSKDICKAHVAGVVERFRSIGHFKVINYFVPTATNRTFTGAPPYSLIPLGIDDTNLWPSSLDVIGSTAAPVVSNSVLVASSINALLAIYNSNPAYCSTGAPYTPSSPMPDWITKPSSELNGSQLNIQIIPYNISTGTPLPCPFPLRISPEGLYSDTNPNSAFGQVPKKADRGTSLQAGLLVRVVQRFISEDGIPTSCSVDQRFQYSADLGLPSAPNTTLIEKISGPDWDSSCTSADNEYAVTFGYGGAQQIEPGAVMVCRDNSIILRNPDTNYKMATCSGAGAPAGQVVGYYSQPYIPPVNWPATFFGIYGPADKVTGLTYDTAYSIRTSDPTNGWVPCHMVTACGIAPATAAEATGSTPEQPKYKLTYKNLPPLCRVNIAAAALDTAANSSINLQTASKAADPSQFDDTKLMVTWDIPMPRCGQACGSCGANCGVNLSTIYFRCGGCL